MPTKAVIFDVDGTLTDCKEIHFRALNLALIHYRYHLISPEDHVSTYDGLSTKQKLNTLLEVGHIGSEHIPGIAAIKQEWTLKLLEEAELFNPAIYCLVAGISRMGYLLGVASNAVEDTVNLILDKMKIKSALAAVGHNGTGRPKPNPDIYEGVIELLDVKPEECLAVEDGCYGVRAAEQAGCRILRVSSPTDLTPGLIWKTLAESN